MSTLRRLARGTAVVLAGNALSAALGFLVFVMLVRTLSPADFGRLAPLISVLDIGQILMDMVIGGGTLVFASRYIKTDGVRANMAFKIAFWTRVAVAVAVALVGLAAAPWMSVWLFDDAASANALRLAFFGILGVAVYTSCISVLQSRQRFLPLAGVILYKNILRLAAVAAVLYFGVLSVESALWVFVGSMFAAAVLAAVSVSQAYLKTPGFDRGVARELLQTNKWMLVLLVILVAGARLDVFMLANLSSAEEVARYAAAFQLSSVVAIFSQTLVTTLFPEIAGLNGPEAIRRFVRSYLKLVPLLALPIVALVALSPWLISVLLGPRYAAASPVFSTLLTLAFITLLSNPLLMALFPMGKVRFLAMANTAQVLARVGLNLVLLPLYGALGAAFIDLGTKLVMVAAVVGYIVWQVAVKRVPVAAAPERTV